MKLHYTLAATALFAIAAVPAFARGTSTEEFVKKASISNQFEIESSRLALDKSDNKQVQEFAQDMMTDHTKTGEKMKDALKRSETGLKAEDTLDAAHQKKIDQLKAAKGPDFDKQYVAMQVKAHNDAVALFEDYSKFGQNSRLKDFAGDTLPTLKEHLQHIEQLELAKK